MTRALAWAAWLAWCVGGGLALAELLRLTHRRSHRVLFLLLWTFCVFSASFVFGTWIRT